MAFRFSLEISILTGLTAQENAKLSTSAATLQMFPLTHGVDYDERVEVRCRVTDKVLEVKCR